MPEDVTKSTLWKPMVQFPASMGDACAHSRVEADYRRMLADEMFPALRHLESSFATTTCRKRAPRDGFGALPAKNVPASRYATETTTDLTPDEIHELGLAEVKRIQSELSRPRPRRRASMAK